MRQILFTLAVLGIAFCQNLANSEADWFYNAAKDFLRCKFCGQIKWQDQIGAHESLKLLLELNRAFDKDPADGIPTELQATTPTPISKIGGIFNHRENVLRRLALGNLKRSAAEPNGEGIEKFCLSLNCDEFDFE